MSVCDDGSGPALYVGGGVPGQPGLIARFDGASWSPLGGGVSATVHALAVFDDSGPLGPALYVGGDFLSAFDSHDSYLARWQGCLDTAAPVLSCPPVVYATDRLGTAPGEVVVFSVTAVDESDPSPSVVCVPPSGSFFPAGATLVDCTATDDTGNASTCQFEVIVQPRFRRRDR